MVVKKGAKPFILVPQHTFQAHHRRENDPEHSSATPQLATSNEQRYSPLTPSHTPLPTVKALHSLDDIQQQHTEVSDNNDSIRDKVLEEILNLGLKKSNRNNKAWDSINLIIQRLFSNKRTGVDFSTGEISIDGQSVPGLKASQFLYDTQRSNTKIASIDSYITILEALNLSVNLLSNRQLLRHVAQSSNFGGVTPEENAAQKENGRYRQKKFTKTKLHGSGISTDSANHTNKRKWLTF